MASDVKPAVPVALRIKLRYDDLDAMVQRFAINVGRSGLFLPTRSMQPIGTEVRFELRLANDVAALVGMGRVKAARPPDAANPRAAFGLSIELMRVTREGREVIMRMIERRRELGLPEVAIPLPEDVEAARRVESAPAPEPTAPVAIAPIASAPIPRPIARVASAPALAPEPPRRKRPKLAELVAKAAELSAPVAAPDLDGPDVDVGKALSRARALAGGDMDVELAALREHSAAPIAIDVEAASAELARQLGGTAIPRRERSARWASAWVPGGVEAVRGSRPRMGAPPPAIATEPVAAEPVAAEPVAAEPDETDELPGEHTQIASNPLALLVDAAPPPATDEDAEEISELDVLAEADAEDDDLLAANGELDSAGFPAASLSLETQPAIPAFADGSPLSLDDGDDPELEFDEQHAPARGRARSTELDPIARRGHRDDD